MRRAESNKESPKVSLQLGIARLSHHFRVSAATAQVMYCYMLNLPHGRSGMVVTDRERPLDSLTPPLTWAEERMGGLLAISNRRPRMAVQPSVKLTPHRRKRRTNRRTLPFQPVGMTTTLTLVHRSAQCHTRNHLPQLQYHFSLLRTHIPRQGTI